MTSKSSKSTTSQARRGIAVAGVVTAQLVAGFALQGTALAAPSTERVNVSTSGEQADGPSALPAVSSDGNVIAFSSNARNLVPGVTEGQVFVRDKARGVTELVSIPNTGGLPNGRALAQSISENGRFVAFQSFASNLVAGDTNAKDDIFVHDRVNRTTIRVSISSSGAQGNSTSYAPAISGDGRYIAFVSAASNLVIGDTNARDDIFVHDRIARTTSRASLGTSGAQGNGTSSNPSINRDGSRIAFESFASNLVIGDTNSTIDVFVASRTGVLLRASVNASGTQGNNSSRNAAISGDGRAVAFDSRATNLVLGDTNSREDVFHHDIAARRTIRVSNGTVGEGNGNSLQPAISHNGRLVAYSSAATNLVVNDVNGVQDVFLANLDAPLGSQNMLVSKSTAGTAADGVSAQAAISSNGLVVGFFSQATNLVAGDTNRLPDIFARRS